MPLAARLTATLAALCLSATLAGASTTGDSTTFFVFGDSLSDNGNLFDATGGTIPAAPYFNGRFSNGPVWADYLATDFSSAGLVTANFAYGFANALENGDLVPDMGMQIGIFQPNVSQDVYGDNPLAALWFGANDIFGAVDAEENPEIATVEAVGVAAAKAVATGIAALATGGISNFLVFNVPDLGTLPAYALFEPTKTPAATAGSLAFNAELDKQVAGLRALGLGVTLVDAYGLYNNVLADPAAFGISDTVHPCYVPSFPICTEDEAATRAFFDWVHPNATLHNALARVVEDAIAPSAVPLPASAVLLLVGLGGLGWIGRRKATI